MVRLSRRLASRAPLASGVCGVALGAFGVVLAGCGDEVRIIECPPGTVPSGSKCLPVEVVDPDTGAPDTEDFPEIYVPDDTHVEPDTTPADTTTPDTATTDTAPDVEAPRATGAACTKNADCAGGTCLDWTGGYCTRLDCQGDDGCGAGELCLPFAGNTVCVTSCAGGGACRAPDQACKTIIGANGLTDVCLGVDADARATGAACTDATDCAGEAACLTAFPGGYCAELGCDVEACPDGAQCVRVDGRPSCLKRCGNDADCGGAAGAERRCGVLESAQGNPVDVCISGVEGKTLGQSCRSDFECTSGRCQVLGEGRCSQTGWPCFPESVASDCNGAEFCQVTPESRVGLCSQRCALGGRTCPGAAYCLAEGDSPREAWCRPSCSGPDDRSCNADAGLVCAFGIPVSDSGQGRYACARADAGSALAACVGDATCRGGACILAGTGGSGGYCGATCGEDSHCAFGGACVFGAGGDQCYRACQSGLDCPGGYHCEAISGAARDVCAPN